MNSVASSPSSQKDMSLHDLLHVDDSFLNCSASPAPGLRRIMVPSDFSPGSVRAMRYARHFALHFGAELWLVNVRDPLQRQSAYCTPDEARQIQDAAILSSTAKLAYLAEGDCHEEDLGRIAFRYLITEGEPVAEVIRIARENDIDLLVISTHGYTGYHHILAGGIADKIVRMAPCPIMVVREAEHDFVSFTGESSGMPGATCRP